MSDTAEGEAEKSQANFSKFYVLYRRTFLGLEATPWYDTHAVRWGAKTAAATQLTNLKAESAQPELPKNDEYNAFMSAVQANQLVANCDEHLRAQLFSHSTHRNLVKAGEVHKWNLMKIYDALREIERDPAFIAAAAERRRAAKDSDAQVADLQALVNAMQIKGGGSRNKDKPRSPDIAREGYLYKESQFNNLSQTHQASSAQSSPSSARGRWSRELTVKWTFQTRPSDRQVAQV